MRGGQRPISDCGGGAADVGTVGIGGTGREGKSRQAQRCVQALLLLGMKC